MFTQGHDRPCCSWALGFYSQPLCYVMSVLKFIILSSLHKGLRTWMISLQEQHETVAIEYLFLYKYCGNLASQVCCLTENWRLQCLSNYAPDLSSELFPPLHSPFHVEAHYDNALWCNHLEYPQEISPNDLGRSAMVLNKIFNNKKGCFRAGKLAPIYIFPVYFPVLCHKSSSCYSSLKKKEWGPEFLN